MTVSAGRDSEGRIYVSAQERIKAGGSKGKADGSTVRAKPTVQLAKSARTQSGSDAPRVTWTTDETGMHGKSTDGHTYDLNLWILSAPMSDPMWKYKESHPQDVAYAYYVDGEYRGVVWIPRKAQPADLAVGSPPALPAQPALPEVDPQEIALSLLTHVSLPTARIGVNPQQAGLVNLPQWFWVEGYDGRPFGTSETRRSPQIVRGLGRVGSLSITVSVRPTSYEWDFGDGQPAYATMSLGKPYPAESNIQHVYRSASSGGFPVTLTIRFAAQYSVNGGAPRQLPAVEARYQTRQRVMEAESVLVRP